MPFNPKSTLPSLLATLIMTAVSALPAVAQDKGSIEAGAGKVDLCIGCHGITGYKTNFPEVYHVPRIAGQGAKYIATVLAEYKSGDRKHPSMRGIADSLSEQDMADVAAYYSALGQIEDSTPLPKPKAANKAVEALLQKGACVSCHGDNYSSPIDPTYPKIAGQYPDYLYAALKSYRDDSHAVWGRGNPVMQGMVKQFSNRELKAMASYIGSLPGEIKTVPQSRFISRN